MPVSALKHCTFLLSAFLNLSHDFYSILCKKYKPESRKNANIFGKQYKAITPVLPTVAGGVTSYSISPALPTGLTINSTTGELSGTPSIAAVYANYTVTAANAGGSTSTIINVGSFETWFTLLGGLQYAELQSVQHTAEGGYILAGYSSSNISIMGGQTPINPYTWSNDFIVIKLNSSGNLSWFTFLGGSSSDVAYSIQQTSDGGFILAGSSSSNISTMGGQTPLNPYTGSNDFLVIKLHSSGNLSWFTFLGGASSDDVAFSIQQTSDGGFILAGSSSSNISTMGGQTPLNPHSGGGVDVLVAKLNSSGNLSWFTFLGGSGYDETRSIQQTSDGGYILAGVSSTNISTMGGQTPLNPYSAGHEILVAKLNSSGNLSWFTFLGGSSSDVAYSIQQTSDGGFILAGSSSSNISTMGGQTPLNPFSGGGDDVLVAKLNSSGNLSWFTFLGGSGYDETRSIQQTSDGGYILAGSSNANIPTMGGQTPLNPHSGGNSDTLVIKLNSSGNLSWFTILGGTGYEGAYSIKQTIDLGYIVAGYSNANIPTMGGQTPLNPFSGLWDGLVIKLRPDGKL